jgi:hypothetical protein
MEATKKNNKRKKNSLSHYLGGGLLLEEFFIKQSKLFILIFFLILIFISNRYVCMKKLTEIENLTNELKELRYENLVISTELTTNSRQSQVEDLLEKKGIYLAASKSPVYEIHK